MLIQGRINSLPSEVKKSITEQLKLLSWAFGSVNGFFRHLLGDFFGIIVVIVGWTFLQFLSHYLIYQIKEDEKEGKK